MFLTTKFLVSCEDDIHKCIKYDVWSSTPNGNRKLDAAFHDAEAKTIETGTKCPIFLFFSVNGSGQFVVKWHVIKDVPSSQLRHITLENNDNKPVTYTRDTQEEEVVSLQRELSTKDQVHTVRPCKQKATTVPSSALSPSASGS
ncbi:hypothetical protein Vadar_034733 [Vaccinium darrowii]|uniref:Uncharacterized protein n=1 Tax=Vaccinium darrowii TaxID=229202 RepID=A0ACB7YAE7_9ERIC|nr:hypothetical protein Vadar_034733 [Vaccinium darrowii]